MEIDLPSFDRPRQPADTSAQTGNRIGPAADRSEIEALLEKLRASEERVALVSAAANLGVWDVDIRAGTGIHNREFRALYGLPCDEQPVAHEEWMKLIHPEDRERMVQAVQSAQAGEAAYTVEFRITRADTGEVRWIASRGSVVKADADGRPLRMVGICHDVTERRQEQERQTLLAREVDHRAKNVLAVVQSIVRLTRAANPQDFVAAVEGRVAALGRAHTLLSRDHWTGVRIAEVVREELTPYGDGSHMALQGPNLTLRPEAVQPFSMFLHELATNAAKYGALSQPGGVVAVSWDLDPATALPHGQLRLNWVERGGPPIVTPPATTGFGSTVIRSTVRGQLEGQIVKTWPPGGLHCEVVVPSRCLIETASPEQRDTERSDGGLILLCDQPPPLDLQGRRVLLAEDEPLPGLDMAATLASLGCIVVGPVASLEQALRTCAAEGARLDAAVLDADLRGADSSPVAALLTAFHVPVVHITGYGTLLSAGRHGGQIVLRKPLRNGDLAAGLRMALSAGRPGAQD